MKLYVMFYDPRWGIFSEEYLEIQGGGVQTFSKPVGWSEWVVLIESKELVESVLEEEII